MDTLISIDAQPLPEERCGVCILGSTGSIGTATLDLLRERGERFYVQSLSAHRNDRVLSEQVTRYSASAVVLTGMEYSTESFSCPCSYGADALLDLVCHPDVHVVVASIVGFACLPPVLAALRAGKRVALANKESVVCGSHLIREALKANPEASLLPVDSEHSALFQALCGERVSSVEKLWLTASGGPFRDTPYESFSGITPEDALKHPTWNMGAKITIDSATMMNKALELIEACYLYDLPEDRVEVVGHPQSIIHSLVEFCDGSQVAQLSHPDMKGPIAFALSYPEMRLQNVMKPLDLRDLKSLEFFSVDHQRFPAELLARECVRQGGSYPCAFNASNEIAVSAFLNNQIGFQDISALVARVVESWNHRGIPGLDELISLDSEARTRTLAAIRAT